LKDRHGSGLESNGYLSAIVVLLRLAFAPGS
jgi:hypothetical protein